MITVLRFRVLPVAILVVLCLLFAPAELSAQAAADSVADTAAAAMTPAQPAPQTPAPMMTEAQKDKGSLDALWTSIVDTSVTYFPKALGALLILILGWLLAMLVSWMTRSVLKSTGMDQKLSRWTQGDDGDARMVLTSGVAKGIFYLIMLFVVVAVFQTLELTFLTEPINRLLGGLFEFVPQLIGAAVLFVVAWIVAGVIRFAVTRILTAMDFDGKFSRGADASLPSGFSLSRTVGDVLYWVTFLVFLPAILGTLGMQGLIEPVQELLNKVLAAIPNLLAAALIFAIGWLVARIVSKFVANVLAALGTDSATERVGLRPAIGDRSVSQLIGTVVYALIIIPVAIAALNTLKVEAISGPAIAMLTTVMNAIPAIFAAALVLVVAYVIARLLKDLVANVLRGVGFDRMPVWLGLSDQPVEGSKSPSEVAGYIVLAAILLLAFVEALALLGFSILSGLMATLVTFGGRIILALVIFGVGLYLANIAHRLVSGGGSERSKFYAQVARYAIIIFTGAMALREMGIADDIINMTFGILLGAVAVAFAIAFGMGSRDIAAKQVEKWLQQNKRSGK